MMTDTLADALAFWLNELDEISSGRRLMGDAERAVAERDALAAVDAILAAQVRETTPPAAPRRVRAPQAKASEFLIYTAPAGTPDPALPF